MLSQVLFSSIHNQQKFFFYIEAIHSFIFASFIDLLNLPTSLLEFDMFISTPVGKSFLATRVLRDDSIFIGDREFLVNLIFWNLKYFDIY